MQHFAIKSLADWHQLVSGEAVLFEPEGRYRTIKLEVVPQSKALVWCSFDPKLKDPKLLASTSEQFTLAFTVDRPVYIWVGLEADDHICSIRGSAPDQRLAYVEKPAFTNIEPRSRRNTELDRMMQYVKVNEQRREQEKAASINAMRAEIEAMRKEREAAEPVLEPVPLDPVEEPKAETKEPVKEPKADAE